MNKLNVVVIYGGCSEEHEISKISAATIMANIPEDKYNVIPLYITKEGEWLLYDGCIENTNNIQWKKFGTKAILSPDRTEGGLLRIVKDKVKTVPVDVVFPALHGDFGEDGTIQGLFEIAGIPYVGCNVLSSAVCMDKAFTKIIAAHCGIKQAPYLVFTESELINIKEVTKKVRQRLGYPCFVKPANTGSSVGITKVKSKEELTDAIQLALQHDRKVIIEKAVIGRELECAVLGSGDDVQASVVGEIMPAAEFYDYDAKYNNSESKTLVPAILDEVISDEIRNTAVKIFKAADCSGLSRVDFFLEEETNKVIFNEINTMPGFTKISMYPMLWAEMGIMLPELIDRLIQLAVY